MAGFIDYLLSTLNKKLPLPTNARVYIESVVDGKKDPITGENFTERELGVIRDLVAASVQSPATPGYVNYGTYAKDIPSAAHVGGMRWQKSADASPLSLFTPDGRVATTLGQFNYQLTDDGDIEVTDNYDFNATDHRTGAKTVGTQYLEANSAAKTAFGIGSLGYLPLRARGQETIPTGEGRPISVTIPKNQFSDEQYEVLLQYLKGR